MADIPQQAQPWGTSAVPTPPDGTASAGGAATSHVPAPTIDVQVRTMESDLASLQASGGNTVAAQTIALQVQKQPGATSHSTHHAVRTIFATVVTAIVLAALAFAGYSLYYRLVQSSSVPPDTTQSSSDDDAATGTAIPAAVLIEELPGAHASFLKQPADARVALVLNNDPVSDPSTLRTYNQTLRDTLKTVTASNAELEVRNGAGKSMTFPGFLTTINAPLIETGLYQENFESDFTFFVTKEGQGFNAAYILKLKEGKNWLFIKNDVAKLETAPGLETLFPTVPGLRDQTFKDGMLGEQTVRTVNYVNPDAQFVYGWFREHLVLATSPHALQEALVRVQ